MKRFNLSDWALEHRSLVWYFMIVFLFAGWWSYWDLGREEDPSFTIKTMVIQANWPGATAEETTRQVTERIERKVEELDNLKWTRSITTAGNSIVLVDLLDTVRGDEVRRTWIRVRNMIGDIRNTFPAGIDGPTFNDRFGDVFGNIYAFTAQGLSKRQLRDLVEGVRAKVLQVPDSAEARIIGAQDEKIFLEFSTEKIAALGVDQQSILRTLQAQNAIASSGVVQAGPERIVVRIGGQFSSEDSLRDVNLRVGERFFRLADVAEITRGYEDPPRSLFRFNGVPAIGLAIGMKQGANLLAFGEALQARMDRAIADLPVGVAVGKVADQPRVVEESIAGFTRALLEAVAIVLAISFMSLGVRAGLVVAISIPLVLAITFVVMDYAGITLQRISLGALIIALGLLVDDAMIAVEMMIARLEVGDSLRKAATHVYTSTAFPMLTGTLVTVAGFIPIGLNSSSAGEFTFTLFVVIAVSLVVSWIVAVLFTPLLGVTLLPAKLEHAGHGASRLARGFSALLHLCLRNRWITIGATLAAFALSIFAMQFVQQQFFPASDRPELIVDFTLPDNASIAATDAQIAKFEAEMLAGNDDVDHWSTYVGNGAPRFLLAFDSPQARPSIGQVVVQTKNLAARDRVRTKLQEYVHRTFVGSDVTVTLLSVGPPSGRPVQYRVTGPDIGAVRGYARELAGVMAMNPNLGSIAYDWKGPSRVLKVEVFQNRARQLGITPTDIAGAINSVLVGSNVTQVRDAIYLIDVVGRAEEDDRGSIEAIKRLQIASPTGASVPIETVARFDYALEQPLIMRRSRIPTLTIKADVVSALQPATVVEQLAPAVDEFAATLPAGFAVAIGGTAEESANAQGPIVAAVPLMLFIMATILMLQLQSFSRLFLVFSIAPFALIGVVLALLPTGTPMGFVAILGVLALIGILIRNSVILIVQIETLRGEGVEPWRAVVEATEHRMRPILLTAAAASLALIPIAREVFWGPMAYAMMGGIIVGTLLTLLFLPALYVAWFRIRPS